MTEKDEKCARLITAHKESIAKYLAKFCAEISFRSSIHDDSKFRKDEFEVYSDNVEEFNKYSWDSPEERRLREKLTPAGVIHRKRNRHHPEYFENGIDGMNLIDLLEMLCDWRSAAERGPGDSIRKNLPTLQEKYNISPQLLKLLENTLKDFNMY